MIPEKNTAIKQENPKEKVGVFSLFDIQHFLIRIIKNWYWFLLFGAAGYAISFIYNRYYVQRIYASNLSLSISNNTASYFTPNQSINFIWGQGGNQDGIFLKKMLLSRSHNEYLVQKLDLFIGYSTKGLLRETYLDKYDSPVILEVDKNHLQQVGYPITLIPQGNGKYEVVLPEEGHSNNLYNYKTEEFETIPEYAAPSNKIIAVNQWYESPNLRFKLINNPNKSLPLDNIIVNLNTVNTTVRNIQANISVQFDEEINSVIIISKQGYNLRETVNFLNQTVEELIEKRKEDQSLVDRNTLKYINDNLGVVRKKLDSSANNLNALKIDKKLYNVEQKDQELLKKIQDLELRKVDLLLKMNSLASLRNSINRNIEDMIDASSAGIQDETFNVSVSELRTLYEKRMELASQYTPDSKPMRDINWLISQARAKSHGRLNSYASN